LAVRGRIRRQFEDLSDDGLEPLKKNIQSIQDTKFESLRTKKGIRSFLGKTGFYSGLIPEYAELAAPLEEAMKTGHGDLVGEYDFKRLKERFQNKLVLGIMDLKRPWELHTDAELSLQDY
jgi:hypothetical protein